MVDILKRIMKAYSEINLYDPLRISSETFSLRNDPGSVSTFVRKRPYEQNFKDK